jgi:hypothetical protein
VDLSEVPDEENDEELSGEAIVLGPGGIDDPETAWNIGDQVERPPPTSLDNFWVLRPGEELEVVDQLPKPKQLRLGVAVGQGELIVCAGKRRSRCRTPLSPPDADVAVPSAERLVVIFVQHRAKGVRSRPRKYIVVTGSDDELMAWLDYSDTWNFDAGILQKMADVVGIRYEVERFATEPEFQLAHPDWIG